MDESADEGRYAKVPPLAAEDHFCVECDLSYSTTSVAQALQAIPEVPVQVCAAAMAVPANRRRERPRPETWSVIEYVCHVRDVYAVYTIRLHRTRTEDRPILEPMLNDLRASRFRYNDRDLTSMLDELTAGVAGFCEESVQLSTSDWERTATRLPGETRTARWLARQALHEGRHHVRDISNVGRTVAGAQ